MSVWEAGRDPREGHQLDAATDDGIRGKSLNDVMCVCACVYIYR